MTVSESQGAAGGAEVVFPEEEIRWVFPTKAQSSESELGSNVSLPNTSELLDFLQPGEQIVASSSSGKDFYDSLQALKRKNRQCLLELGLIYQVRLENHNRPSKEDKELEEFFQDNGRLTLPTRFHEALRSVNLRSFSSLTNLTVDNSKDEQNHHSFPQSFSRSKSASAAWISSITIPQPFKMTLREARKKLKSHVLLEIESATYKRQSQEEAECQKQFRAQPVPAHIYLPLYQEIMEKNEIRRQMETQKRRELLLSMQKPFSFHVKEEKRKEAIGQKVLEALTPIEKSVPKVRKKISKSIYEPVFGDKLKEAELLRKIRIQMRAKDLLESSWAPIELGNRQRESQIASKNREQKLSFLQNNFSFKPRINTSVPDFDGLYWAFQREAISKQEIKEPTHNKPFRLRTSNLHCKHRVSNDGMMDFQQPSKAPIRRSRSLTYLSSLSSNTLPIYITDAVRKRESAIKLLQEDKKYKENEGARWAELQRKKCQAVHKSLRCRANALDPHKSLEETHREKLKQNWQNDQKRTREYKKELEEMKMRVKNRPYLFEQVTKNGARQGAERLFRDTLQQFGLNEEFVKNKGRDATNGVGKEQSESQRIQTLQRNIDAGIIQELAQEGQRILELKQFQK
ncbi:protein FAM161B [Rhineura floridana]|uniref:protein FAM161B n=1 Tax=Rhineura floridana TaxID=261503 RepID=UPI002AC857A3|nr:protein FAM161B [Rhineura floridana]